jgi:hypothetical protein
MKEACLEEFTDFIVVAKLSTTLQEMLNPVETCILNLGRKTVTSVTSTPGVLRPQMSCFKEAYISRMQLSANVRCACFSSTQKFGSLHLSLSSRKSRNEGWWRRSGRASSFGISSTILIGSQDNTSYKILRLIKVRFQNEAVS